jgi:hypothetical protein
MIYILLLEVRNPLPPFPLVVMGSRGILGDVNGRIFGVDVPSAGVE